MPKKNIAIVTGASSGLGKEFVKLMAKEEKVDEIWAIARNEQKLAKMANGISGNVRTFSIDLSNSDNVMKFGDALKEAEPNVLFLINNAGFGKFGSYYDVKIKESINMIGLNCGGMVAMGLVCIPYMRKKSHIVNVSSQASFQPLPYFNLYSSTKAFIRNYSRALHVELREKGITVTAVCSGWIETEFFRRANTGAEQTVTNYMGMTTPDKVAAKALRDAKRGKDTSVYGLYTKACHVMAKWLPQKMVMKIWLIQQGIK